MVIEKGSVRGVPEYFLVRVAPGELGTSFGFTAGTILVSGGKINVWTPATSVPRGYKEKARKLLDAARDSLVRDGKVRLSTVKHSKKHRWQ